MSCVSRWDSGPHALHDCTPSTPTRSVASLQNAVYGCTLAGGAGAAAASSAASSYKDSYAVEPAWAGDLAGLPPGVLRVVGGARKLFEVRAKGCGHSGHTLCDHKLCAHIVVCEECSSAGLSASSLSVAHRESDSVGIAAACAEVPQVSLSDMACPGHCCRCAPCRSTGL
jgi:hypothetical protein